MTLALRLLPIPAFPALTWIRLLAVLFVVMLLGGCALNPIAVAETPDQKYDATLLTYDAILEPALTLLEDPTTPVELRRTLQQAIAASGNVYTSATQAYANFKNARALVAAGGEGRALEVATENLERWLAELEQTLANLQQLADR